VKAKRGTYFEDRRVKLFWILCLGFIGLEALLVSVTYFPKSTSPTGASIPKAYTAAIGSTSSPASPGSVTQQPAVQEPIYKIYTLPEAIVHTVLIPAASQHQVIPAITPEVATLKDFAQPHQAIAVINGGYFDPENHQSTAYVTLDKQLAVDPQQNDRLTRNPNLAPYLSKVLNRSEFRQYQCEQAAGGQTIRYDITLHNDPTPADCQLISALGAGPRLLPDLNLQPESFLETDATGAIARDPIDYARLSPRSAIGMTTDGSIILVMVAEKPDLPEASGMTLQGLADFMKSLDVQRALNLDGGSSASLYYNGTTYHGKLDENGQAIDRPVKSVLVVK
jgi:Phosphodiester glycosidase